MLKLPLICSASKQQQLPEGKPVGQHAKMNAYNKISTVSLRAILPHCMTCSICPDIQDSFLIAGFIFNSS